ncbi:hypothetical protein GC207_02135 [bacterium]|nr:hypothetical protein [bacterium]
MKQFPPTHKSTMLLGVALSTVLVSSLPVHADNDRHDEHDQRNWDHVVLSFSTVGDSRQDPSNPDPTQLDPNTGALSGQDASWLQSTKAWSRMIDAINVQKCQFLFFNGDMIMGYGNAGAPSDNSVDTVVNSDLMKFYRQYGFWRGMVAGLMEKGTYVVPVPGNHETQWKKAPLPGGGTGKRAQAVNENAWRANMGDLILDTARFQNLFGETPANFDTGNNAALDGLTTDQSQLSYSFDFRGSHFAVINTDPVGHDAHAPVHWLATDLAAAQSRGMKHFFVFGHKPAFTYYFGADIPAAPDLPLPGSPAGLDNDVPARDAFWNVIEQYRATYFCGHEHIFNMSQPTGNSRQVLVGSGGSPFEAAPTDATISPTDRYYAWATVEIFESGRVRITAFGFDDHFGRTRVLKSVVF